MRESRDEKGMEKEQRCEERLKRSEGSNVLLVVEGGC